MKKLEKVRASINREKRHMLENGTSYRKKTAVFSSRLLNDLASSNSNLRLSRIELTELARARLQVTEERATDVAKSIHVHLKSIDDQQRLAKYYQKADELLQKN